MQEVSRQPVESQGLPALYPVYSGQCGAEAVEPWSEHFVVACAGGKTEMSFAEALAEYVELVTIRTRALLAQRPRKLRHPRPRRMRR